MNKLLAGAVRFLNGLLALLFVAGGTLVGAEYGGRVGGQESGMIVGFIAGFAVALVVCGFLALFIEMRSELIKIRGILETKPKPISS
jgi:hypothetical protein